MDHIIKDLAILLLVSLPINILFHKIRLPSIMGFLVAGVIIGPSGLQLIDAVESVEKLAEIGVILLLFVIGLEFSLRYLLKNLTVVLGVGMLQLGLTGAIFFFVFDALEYPLNQSVLMALLIPLSSTAVVLKMITDRAEIDTLHGRICIGTLLFQDLCVVPMMLVIPLLAQSGELSPVDFGIALTKSIAAVAVIFFLARLLVPRSLEGIARMGNKEHLTLFVIFIILGTGWVSESMGLTLAMGAFIAGMIISESEYSHQIVLDILPLKDYFVSIFFISVGMLLKVDVFFASAGTFFIWALAAVGIKMAVAFLAALIFSRSFRNAFIVGVRLAQVGEFSLLLAALALKKGLFPPDQYQSFLIVSILTLLAAPLLIQVSAGAAMALQSLFGGKPDAEVDAAQAETTPFSDHVIICGFSLVGRNLSRVLKETNTPFVVVDLDGEIIRQALQQDIKAQFGDYTHRETLIRAGIRTARMIVFTIPDTRAAEQAVRLSRSLNPDVYILVRVPYASQVEEMNAAGADQVIPEEFETSVEIFSRVLREYHIPNNVIEQQVELARLEGYSMFRGLSLNMESLQKFSTYLTASLTESFHVQEDAWCNEKTVAELKLSSGADAKLIAVVRGNDIHANPEEAMRLTTGDILILFGRHAPLNRSIRTLRLGHEESRDQEEESRRKESGKGRDA